MVDAVARHKVELDDESTASTGGNLDKLPPLGVEFLPCRCPQLGGPVGNGFPRQVGPGHHVPQQHSLQGFLVLKELVKRINWNLVKSRVSGGKYCEGPLS